MALKQSQEGLDNLKKEESLQLKAYVCPAGVLTIGYGHTGPDVHEGMAITQEQADLLLDLDTNRFEAFVNQICPHSTQDQFDAMVSLCYNIGEAGFKSSSVARLHNAHKCAEAAQSFMLWNKCNDPSTGKKKVSRGLTSRRNRESEYYLRDQVEQESYTPPSYAEGEVPLSSSRTMQGAIGGTSAIGATAAVGAVGVQPILDAVTQNHDLVQQILPMIERFWWILPAVGVGFLGYSMWGRISDRLSGRS